MNEPSYGFQVAMINSAREKKPDEVQFGPRYPPSNFAFNYLTKYQFVVGKGIGKDLQGDPELVPVRKSPRNKGLGFSGGPKRNQWKRVSRPAPFPAPAVKTVYRGIPEPFPLNGSMYLGLEIFKDVIDFNEYADGYKEVNLLEAKPESMEPAVEPVEQEMEVEPKVSDADTVMEELKNLMEENFADQNKELVGVIKEKAPEIVELLKNLMVADKEKDPAKEEETATEGLPPVGDDYIYDVSSIFDVNN